MPWETGLLRRCRGIQSSDFSRIRGMLKNCEIKSTHTHTCMDTHIHTHTHTGWGVCLTCNPKELRSIPRSHIKEPDVVAMLVIPDLW